jgi:hypothetical protein
VNVATGTDVESVLLPAGNIVLIFAVTLRAVQIYCAKLPNSTISTNMSACAMPKRLVLMRWVLAHTLKFYASAI